MKLEKAIELVSKHIGTIKRSRLEASLAEDDRLSVRIEKCDPFDPNRPERLVFNFRYSPIGFGTLITDGETGLPLRVMDIFEKTVFPTDDDVLYRDVEADKPDVFHATSRH